MPSSLVPPRVNPRWHWHHWETLTVSGVVDTESFSTVLYECAYDLNSGSTLTTGLLLCKTVIRLISGCLSPMGMALDQQWDLLRFFKCQYLYPYLACHVTKTEKGLKVRPNMPYIVDTALLVLNQCSLQCYGWIFQTFAYFGNCCITRGPCGTFS